MAFQIGSPTFDINKLTQGMRQVDKEKELIRLTLQFLLPWIQIASWKALGPIEKPNFWVDVFKTTSKSEFRHLQCTAAATKARDLQLRITLDETQIMRFEGNRSPKLSISPEPLNGDQTRACLTLLCVLYEQVRNTLRGSELVHSLEILYRAAERAS